MVLAADYQVLDTGNYDFPFAEVLYRAVVRGTQKRTGWRQFGDVDNFTMNLNVTKVSRYAKNRSVRTKAIEIVTQIDSAISFKCMQIDDYVRACALLGVPVAMTQVAGNGTYTEEHVRVGDIVYVGAYDVSGVTVKAGGGAGVDVPAGSFKVVDPALGGVQILAIPAEAIPVVEGGDAYMPVTVSFTKAAITAADARTRIDVGRQPSIDLEIMVRGVSAQGVKGVLHVLHAQLAPANDVAFIGDNDFVGIDITGSAVLTSQGVGYWQKLAA